MLFRIDNKLIEVKRDNFITDNDYYLYILKLKNIRFSTKNNNINKDIIEIINSES